MQKCDKKDCGKDATHAVRLSLAVNPVHEPAMSSPFLHVCDDHKVIEWDDVVTDEAWTKIKENFEAIGRMAPKRCFSKVLITPIV